MNNEIAAFTNPEFGSIRTVTINDDPWFVGKDVAKTLGYERGTRPSWITSTRKAAGWSMAKLSPILGSS
ncbi:MAG: BRO family protein [Atopobiaceae bacterium]|jgi:prophage antirepressor-like protein